MTPVPVLAGIVSVLPSTSLPEGSVRKATIVLRALTHLCRVPEENIVKRLA